MTEPRNNFYQRLSAFICSSILFFSANAVARAALPIDIEVAAESGAPFGAMQDWGKLLNGMDLYRVRLRGANGGDEPSVKATGEGESQRFKLVGLLNRRDQLVLPGGTFAVTDRARLQAYFESLPEKSAEQGVERGIFGLTKQQFEGLYEELSPPVTISTKGMKPAAIVTALKAGLSTPLVIDAAAQAALNAAPPLNGELKGLSTGTALAIALRPATLTIFPEQKLGQPLTLRVIPASRERRGWPAGWKPAKADRETVPGMYRFTNIEISGYTLAEALEALGPAMGVPLLFDERVLAVRKIDPAKVDVELKHGKRYIRRAVDQVLSKGRLVGDLRVDEAEKPFYWITQFGPDSLPAAAAK
ncbi:hypothetical protein [Lacipirellula sp.]|uniref:hypothetical protein n=1 Tax=Lacipirellula sp. TaxID=2691419 RepID=UPI003D0E0023